MPTTWTTDRDRALLVAILAANPALRVDKGVIALYVGSTKDAVDWRFRKIKQEAKELREKVARGDVAPATKRRVAQASVSKRNGPPAKKQKTNKFKKKPSVKREYSSDEEEEEVVKTMSEEDRSQEASPVLDDGDAESVTSIEPENPTKVLPSRHARKKPGDYKKLDEGSGVESEDEGYW